MTSRKGILFKVAVGFILGIIFGIVLEQTGQESPLFVQSMPILNAVGNIFIRLLQLLIIPLVLSSLLVGTASLGDIRTLGRIGVRTIFWFAVTSVVSIAIGLFLANVISPGIGLPVEGVVGQGTKPQPFMDVLLGMIPGQPVRPQSFLTGATLVDGVLSTTSATIPFNAMTAISEGVMLQIIFFAILLGIAASMVGEKAKPMVDFFSGLAEGMYGVTNIVLGFAPYGVFALIAATAARYGIQILMPFAKVIACVYIGVAFQLFVTYSALIATMVRKSPVWFFKGVAETAMTAFVTRSSSGTLPITMDNARTNLQVPSNIAAFVLPLGATINMNGTALYMGVSSLFVAQAYGLELTIAQQATVVLSGTLAAVGAAGVPGAGLIMLTMVLSAVGLPLEGVGLVAGIDVVLDMARTCINVVGDQAVACVVAKAEGAYDTDNES